MDGDERRPATGPVQAPVRAATRVMGVLNVTPDSFSDGGSWPDVERALAHGVAMLEAGAAVVDVGGESTRPGATPVPVDEETARVVPVIEALTPLAAARGARVSVDTRHAAVAHAALDAGATILNDVSASLEHVAAEHGAAWIAMHMLGEPATMQDAPTYDDVVGEVVAHLSAAAARGRAAGVGEVWVDPGIGFGKTFDHNWALLAELDRITASAAAPVLVGTSRKGFLGAVTAAADGAEAPAPTDDRLEASVATAVWAASMGAAMVRVHDVPETVAALAAARETGLVGVA